MSRIERYAISVLGPIHRTADLTRHPGRVFAVTDLEGPPVGDQDRADPGGVRV